MLICSICERERERVFLHVPSVITIQQTIMIQAQVHHVEDVLQAEAQAQALLLGTLVAKALNLTTYMAYLSDSKLLIQTLTSDNPIQATTNYRIRSQLSEIMLNTQGRNAQYIKIQRTQNSQEHRLAKQAATFTGNTHCLFSCFHLDHTSNCPVRHALQSVPWGSFSLFSVTCI